MGADYAPCECEKGPERDAQAPESRVENLPIVGPGPGLLSAPGILLHLPEEVGELVVSLSCPAYWVYFA